MSSALDDLIEESGDLFSGKRSRVSYPLGFPILDQLLGCKYFYVNPDGTTR